MVLAENATLLQQPEFLESLLGSVRPAPTLAYGQVAEAPGLHIMETPTRHPVEVLSGLGATGVEVMLAAVQGPPLQGHPMIPLLQISADRGTIKRWGRELDAVFDDWAEAEADDRAEEVADGPEQISRQLLDLLARTASREYTPKLYGLGNTDFQLTRGRLGISM